MAFSKLEITRDVVSSVEFLERGIFSLSGVIFLEVESPLFSLVRDLVSSRHFVSYCLFGPGQSLSLCSDNWE